MGCEYLIIEAIPYLFYGAVVSAIITCCIDEYFPNIPLGWLFAIVCVLLVLTMIGIAWLIVYLQDKVNNRDNATKKSVGAKTNNAKLQQNKSSVAPKEPAKRNLRLIISLSIALLISVAANIFLSIKHTKTDSNTPIAPFEKKHQQPETIAYADSIINDEYPPCPEYIEEDTIAFEEEMDTLSLFDSLINGIDAWEERATRQQEESSQRLVCVYGISGDSIIEECYPAPEINLTRCKRGYGMYIYPKENDYMSFVEFELMAYPKEILQKYIDKMSEWQDIQVSIIVCNNNDSVRINDIGYFTKYESGDTIAFLSPELIYWCPF